MWYMYLTKRAVFPICTIRESKNQGVRIGSAPLIVTPDDPLWNLCFSSYVLIQGAGREKVSSVKNKFFHHVTHNGSSEFLTVIP